MRSLIAALGLALAPVTALQAGTLGAPPPLPLSDQLYGPKGYDHRENRAAVEQVDAAGALMRQQGAAAFPAFRVQGSRWNAGDRYVFVLNRAGEILVYPLKPALESVAPSHQSGRAGDQAHLCA